MRHLGARSTCREGRTARIGEEVQHPGSGRGAVGRSRDSASGSRSATVVRTGSRHGAEAAGSRVSRASPVDRTAEPPHVVVDKVPVGGLFGKDADVLERREGQAHPQLRRPTGIGHRPAVGHLRRKTPLASFVATGVAQKRRIGHPPPLRFGECPPPDGLRFGAPCDVASEAFEFLEIARVDEFVIREIGGQLLLHGIFVDFICVHRLRGNSGGDVRLPAGAP